MSPPAFEDFYRQLHTGNAGDLEFYARLIENDQDVLELGCGWGRVAAHLAPRCRSMTGLESSPRFCEMARENLLDFQNVRIERHDVRTPWEWDGPSPKHGVSLGLFDRILAPYNLLYALGGDKGVMSTFQFVRDHLRQNGEFWCDVYPMDELQAALVAGEQLPDDDDEPVGELEFGGRKYPVIESSQLDAKNQSLAVTYRALDPEADNRVFSTTHLEHHYLLLPQITRLLAAANLEVDAVFGGFDGRPYDDDAEQLILCASRK